MFYIQLIEIIPAALLGMILGALWYSPVLFGNAWLAAIGHTRQTLGPSKVPMIGSMVACILMALGVSILFQIVVVDSLSRAIGLGLLLGGLIIFPAMLSDSLFSKSGIALLIIQCGYRFVKVVLIAVVVYLI